LLIVQLATTLPKGLFFRAAWRAMRRSLRALSRPTPLALPPR
jgi:hypothetical protein